MRIEAEIALECFLWGLEIFSRRDCGLLLAGYRVCEGERRVERLLARLEQQKLLERTGRGKKATFTITDRGRRRQRVNRPSDYWNRSWDGQWRVFFFDLPSHRTKDRQVLWRALRDAKMGLLQRSVWIWPHEVEPLLQDVIQAHGIPECFCGFRATSLFLSDNQEVISVAWDFEAIDRAHETYLKHLVANVASLNRARDLKELARVARMERDAYQYAYAVDPLLPRKLWLADYQGVKVEERHQAFESRLRARLKELAVI